MRRLLTLVILALVIFLVSFSKDNSLEKIKEKGKFVVGLDDTFAPMGFRDKNGEIVGFDIDLAKETAKRLGVEVEFKPCEWDGILFELNSKKIDMVWNGMAITEGRKKKASFSKPYHESGQVVFTKKENKLLKVEELAGKIVGVQLGSTGDLAIQTSSIISKLKEVKKYGTIVEALLDLEAGRIDAVVTSSTSGGYYNSKNQTLNMLSKPLLPGEKTGIAFRKEDVALREKIDEIMDEMKLDGTYEKAHKKWFGE